MTAAVDDSTLPADLRKGLNAIRASQCPEARVVVVADNFAYISLGKHALPDLYEEAEADIFVRIAVNFPYADPYGLVTVPFLHRKDKAAIDRQHETHAYSEPIRRITGASSVGFWSWSWERMPKRRAEDLAASVEWARKRIREG